MAQQQFRLGFAVRSVARPELRLPANPPHLSVALVHLRDMLIYLDRIDVRLYRIPNLFGNQHNPDQQLADCRVELAHIAELAAASGIRLSMHLDHSIALASDDAAAAARSLAQIELQARLLASLEAGSSSPSTMVVHLGGPAQHSSYARFLQRYHSLSAAARARLVLEHDHHNSLAGLLNLHRPCGVPLVFDLLHWRLHNPEQLPLALALGLAMATWPAGRRPETHLSSQRTEAHLLPARAGQAARVLAPRPGQHADYINPADAVDLLTAAHGLPAFDIMLEAKAGDLALLRLREQLQELPHYRLSTDAAPLPCPPQCHPSPVL